MTLAGLAPILKSPPDRTRSTDLDSIAILGFFGAAVLLAAFSFRRLARTPSELIPADPTERGRLWRARMTLLAMAILSAGFIAVLGQTVSGVLNWREINSSTVVEPVLLSIITISSVAFWTLLTRSVFRGIVLTVAAQLLLYLLLILLVRTIDAMAPGIPYAERLSHQPDIHSALLSFVAGFALAYAVLMLYLSRRRFALAFR
jgi:hypothetical protein